MSEKQAVLSPSLLAFGDEVVAVLRADGVDVKKLGSRYYVRSRADDKVKIKIYHTATALFIDYMRTKRPSLRVIA